MAAATNDLLKITGIGPVLAQRLGDASLDSLAALVAAGETGLKGIAGLNPRNIPSILKQAATLVAVTPDPAGHASGEPSPVPVDDLQAMISELRAAIQKLAAVARERFPEELAGKLGHKLTRNMVAGLDALYGIEELLERRPKRSRKALTKAMKRLEGLADAAPDRIRKGLKRVRKALEQVTA